MKTHTILFLAANPMGTNRLGLDLEARAIQTELDRAGYRDRFELVTRWAVQPLDLLRELRRLKPTVVHFSGHGHGQQRFAGRPRDVPVGDPVGEPELPHGLIFQGADGRPQVISTTALQEMFGAARSSVRLVVLNACYTEAQSDALLAQVECVIGVDDVIRDDAARIFAAGFYGGLGAGESVEAAYGQGRMAILMEGMPDRELPVLKVRNGIDANQIVLAADSPASTPPDMKRLLAMLTAEAPPDELLPIAAHVGACVASRRGSMLTRLRARAHQLHRDAPPDSWHRGFADGLTACLDGYFAEIESAQQREEIVREIAERELWREILHTLRDGQALNQVEIGRRVSARARGVASSKSAISIALEDLRTRELVDHVPSKTDRRERIYSLTARGREVLEEAAEYSEPRPPDDATDDLVSEEADRPKKRRSLAARP